jgi:PQQ-like domain
VRPRTVILVALLAIIFSFAFVRASGADGGGRGEDVVAERAQLWTTIHNRVVGVDGVTGQKVVSVVTGSYGTQVAAGGGLVWQLQPWKLMAIDPSVRRVRMRIPLLHATYTLATGYGAVWLPSFAEDTLRKVDAHDGKRRWETHVAHSPQAVTVGAGSVWVASIGRWHKGRGGVVVTDGPGIVSRLDPETGTAVAQIAVGSDASAIAVGAGSVWVLSGRNQHSANILDRIDPKTNHVVATIRVPHWTAAVAVGAHYVWVVSEPRSAGGVVTRINPSSDRAISRKIPHSWIPAAVAVVGKRVWIADPGVAQLIGLDAQTLRVSKRVDLPVG